MARPVAFDRAITLAMDGTRDQVQQRLVDVIHREKARVTNEFHPDTIIDFVDNDRNKPIEKIKPFGRYVGELCYLRTATHALIETLRQTSPFKTGTYQAAHNVFIDGIPIAPVIEADHMGGKSLFNYSILNAITDQSSVIVTSTVPYARRIETGKKKDGSPWAGTNNIYRSAANTVRRLWGSVVIVKFGWKELDQNSGPYLRQPAITLTRAN